MGQYFILVNVDKKEYINPLDLHSGMKYVEMIWSIPKIWWFLLRMSNRTGGGDVDVGSYKYLGRWALDRVVVVGEYDSSDLFKETKLSCKNISEMIKDEYKRFERETSQN